MQLSLATFARFLARPAAALTLAAASFGPGSAAMAWDPVPPPNSQTPAPAPTAADPAAPVSTPTALDPSPAFLPLVNPSAVSSPSYAMSMFLWGHADSTGRDLSLATSAGFSWQKTLFQWREIEGNCKGCFNWTEADRVVKASNQAGVKVIGRLDFEPMWSRKDQAHNAPPDNYQDYADFVSAFVSRYRTGSPIGQVS